ncbi:MAG: undecaprenyl-diphosphatase [Candidatus Hydrogenedentota bacterium]
MVYLNAIILAIVEGLTEFLPVSSTGHLILVEDYLPVSANPASKLSFSFIVLIQLPAIMAVALYFRKKLWPFGGDEPHRVKTINLWFNIAVAVVPAVVLGLMFDEVIESALFWNVPVAIALVAGGIILIAIESRRHSIRFESVHELGFMTALYIGFFQCLAMIPGTSRSAATIIGAMLLGASRTAAAEFSFFLAIPTMFGASLLTVFKSGFAFTAQEWAVIGLGSIVSFATAYLSVAFLMRYIQRHDFKAFGWYRIALGAAVLIAHFF